jgi:hypothetical protein
LQKVDRRVKQAGLKFLFEIDVTILGFGALDVRGQIDERDNVDCELAQDGADDVRVEDVVLGAFFGECLYWLIFVHALAFGDLKIHK